MSMTQQSTPFFLLCSLNFTLCYSTHRKEIHKRYLASKQPQTRSLRQKSLEAIAFSSTELHQVSFRQIGDSCRPLIYNIFCPKLLSQIRKNPSGSKRTRFREAICSSVHFSIFSGLREIVLQSSEF